MNQQFFQKYISFVDNLSSLYQYDSNIRHLLYLIIPAFIERYSLSREKLILDTFENVSIVISDEDTDHTEAFYTSIPYYDYQTIRTKKCIVIYNYQNISLIKLLDDLVHEFNHAVNSYKNELYTLDDILYIRTGITYSSYSLPKFSSIKKDDSYVLEEILNTKQTEEIIDIIKKYNFEENEELSNTIYAINSETNEKFQSKAYFLEKTLLQPILDNRTFVSTLNLLRITGNVQDVSGWFNHIMGQDGSFQKMILLLKKLMDLEIKWESQKIFKNLTLNQMKNIVYDILSIIHEFNRNCTYQ